MTIRPYRETTPGSIPDSPSSSISSIIAHRFPSYSDNTEFFDEIRSEIQKRVGRLPPRT